ncbi:MAG: hypothetical protein C0481_11700 [Phenylobacterium sp.]|uniref:MmcQ/YjbR family DNA-binding protein n=1 Tax=Phenylobacterium sp. TaxID=1871053 RepID=UPI0025CBB2F7|nr:MmcQ/YjbR family DNA-binding protein [Phenylobacterium sp.]MBA4012521.1 hypothetical protein [Phenylobacterium sp.]
MSDTPHQRAEALLTAYGLSFPGTTSGPGWAFTRALYVNRKMFAVFGDKAQPLDALTLIVKLPISAEMAAGLPFVREAKGWYKQHDWVTADFGPEDDILAELETLKAWLRQSYVAIAPKKLSKLIEEAP